MLTAVERTKEDEIFAVICQLNLKKKPEKNRLQRDLTWPMTFALENDFPSRDRCGTVCVFFFFFWPVGFSHHPHHLSFKKLVIKKRTPSIDCNRRNALSKTKSYKTIFQSSKFLFTANLFYFDYVMAHLYSTLPSPIQDIPKKYFTYSAEWL